jgi:FAD/FMN-containing dehydrogenase
MTTDSHLAGFQGALIRPEDDAYDEARRLWNGAIDRRPALIARCAGEDDAALALAHALGEDLPVSVRGGGHNVSGSAICEGGVVIDLSLVRGVEVDPARRVARVQPGALWGDVDRATQAYGLATPAGIVSETGVAGLTVGGGFGWLSRRWGLTSDNLIAARLLLADGSRVRASEDEHPDLFWAVRGGGGNFGIVTEFEFRLHDLGTEVLAGPLLYRADQARAVLVAYREFVATAPDALAVYANMRAAPALDWVPADLRGTDVLMLIPCYSGDLDVGEALLEPLRRSVVPIADLVWRKPYLAHQSMFDAAVPPHWGYYWKSHYLPPLSDGAIDVILEFAWKRTSLSSFSLLFHLGGAIAARSEETSAARSRDAALALNINAAWPEGGPSHPDTAWCREYAAAMAPHATGGVYVNFLHNDEGEARIRAAYGSSYEQLGRIKALYDPGNIFRSNQNIRPADAREHGDSWGTGPVTLGGEGADTRI